MNVCLCKKRLLRLSATGGLSNFSKMENVWKSEEFVAGDCKWKVWVYPKGSGKSDGRYISIYLYCDDASNFAPHKKVNARSSLGIKKKLNDANHSEKIFNHWFGSASDNWGYAEFIGTSDMMSSKGFLVDDCCFLEVEISVQAVVLDAPN